MADTKQKNNNPQVEEEEEDEHLTLDSIIDEFFSYEDQRRRFKSEISLLLEVASSMNIKVDLEHTSSNLSVIVGIMTNQFDFGSSFGNQECINFEIDISQKYYPQKGTRIYCKSPFLNPCLCDGRDFLQDIMGHAWNSQLSFIAIAEQIVEFMKELVKHKTDSIYLQRLGRYYIGSNYKYDDIKQFSSLVRIPCVQFEDGFFPKLHVRIIGITDAHFLVFDAEDAEKRNNKLIFWSDLQSLVEIKRRKDEPSKLSFKWKNYQKQNGQIQFFEQTFQITEHEQIIQQILKKIQKFQRIKIWSNSYMNFGTQWDSKKQSIEQLTTKVFKYEEEIKHKFNIENVQKLIDSYNEVIEHYSSVNDYLSDIFLNSLHNLLNRPDVQCLLNFESEKKHLEEGKSLKKQNSSSQNNSSSVSQEEKTTIDSKEEQSVDQLNPNNETSSSEQQSNEKHNPENTDQQSKKITKEEEVEDSQPKSKSQDNLDKKSEEETHQQQLQHEIKDDKTHQDSESEHKNDLQDKAEEIVKEEVEQNIQNNQEEKDNNQNEEQKEQEHKGVQQEQEDKSEEQNKEQQIKDEAPLAEKTNEEQEDQTSKE